MAERRVDNRYMCSDLLRVDWQATDGSLQSTEAVLEDISPSGACIQTEEPLPAGAAAILCLDDLTFLGTICYCSFHDCGFFAGVRFSEETQWSASMATPRHLTDLREIALRG